MNNDLVMLKKIDDLREMWKNEASDFTPWLEENIHHLDSAISLKLIDVKKEVPVGPYFADIVATDIETGKIVVIENQLEKTDHDHLGKAITYASNLRASRIIWIASEFTKEHRQALNWLNYHMKKAGVKFYGIQIELLQVNDGQQYVRFNVKVNPDKKHKPPGEKHKTGNAPKWTQDIGKIWNKIKHVTKKQEDSLETLPESPKKEMRKEFFVIVHKCIDAKDAKTLYDESALRRAGRHRGLANLILKLEQSTPINPKLE